MKRITTGEVKKAYKAIGAKPVRGTFGSQQRCCPQLAMGFVQHGNNRSKAINWAGRVYGEAYAKGFRNGYDNRQPDGKTNKRYYLGYLDGRRVARALGYTVRPLKKAA